MTREQFIAAVEAKPIFRKWAIEPTVKEKTGDIEKWHGLAYIDTSDGTNTYNVWFMVDTATGETTWQNHDTMTPEANTLGSAQNALETYMKANFVAYFMKRADLKNRWVEADVFAVSGSDLTMSTVLVYKQGNNPITHRRIV